MNVFTPYGHPIGVRGQMQCLGSAVCGLSLYLGADFISKGENGMPFTQHFL